jgi:hypothetical protein
MWKEQGLQPQVGIAYAYSTIKEQHYRGTPEATLFEAGTSKLMETT